MTVDEGIADSHVFWRRGNRDCPCIRHEGKSREESRMTPGFRSDITVLTDTWISEGYS